MSYLSFPLLSRPDPDATVSWCNGTAISQKHFLKQAKLLAQHLPQDKYAINLCEDRYYFLLVFVAMLLRDKINLLPANRSINELQSVSSRYGNCPCIVEKHQSELDLEQHVIELESILEEAPEDIPVFPSSHPCAVVFTSGSTGQSVPWEKSWGELYSGAKLTERALALNDKMRHTVVATVPPQHMYGLETTIILPLVAGISVDSGRPFFPNALQHALSSASDPRLLITTPVHLNACLEANIAWPKVDRVISATAPLTTELAKHTEETFGCIVQEIYGSTETGAIATRRTSTEDKWTLHHGLQMYTAVNNSSAVSISGGHLSHPITLHDRIRKHDERHFTLLGRNSDMVKIAGKRVSLGDLNHKLLAIPGVMDGVFVETSSSERQAVPRLCALVVAPDLSRREILDALKMQIDPVCLPRPLYQVEQLPRTATGKLPQKVLHELLAQLRKE